MTCVYGLLEGLMGLLSIENALRAETIDTRPAGWLVPACYAAGYLAIPVFEPNEWAQLMLVGVLGLRVWVVLDFWDHSTVGVSTFTGLHSSGAYRFVRHPMMLTGLLARIGFCIANPIAWNWFGLLLMTFAAVVVVVVEEQFLTQQAEWRQYASKVKYKLVPKVW